MSRNTFFFAHNKKWIVRTNGLRLLQSPCPVAPDYHCTIIQGRKIKKHCPASLWWSAVTAVSIEPPPQCGASAWIQCQPSAAARASVLEERDSLCQSNPLAKAGVPDASAVMIHTQREGVGDVVYFRSPDTDIVHAVTSVFTVSVICTVIFT